MLARLFRLQAQTNHQVRQGSAEPGRARGRMLAWHGPARHAPPRAHASCHAVPRAPCPVRARRCRPTSKAFSCASWAGGPLRGAQHCSTAALQQRATHHPGGRPTAQHLPVAPLPHRPLLLRWAAYFHFQLATAHWEAGEGLARTRGAADQGMSFATQHGMLDMQVGLVVKAREGGRGGTCTHGAPPRRHAARTLAGTPPRATTTTRPAPLTAAHRHHLRPRPAAPLRAAAGV